MASKSTTNNEKALVPAGVVSFDLSVVRESAPQLDKELLDEIDETDQAGFEDEGSAFPIVEIRQKDLKNEKGKTIADAGGFSIYDPTLNGDGENIADVPAEQGLYLTFLLDQSSRVYFPEVGASPTCRSNDGKHGNGEFAEKVNGGLCELCPMSKIVDGTRAKCKAQKNILAFDHVAKAPYVLRLGPSGLTPYKHFKNRIIKRMNLPMHTLIVKVSSDYRQDPAPHYVPVFEVVDQLPLDIFRKMKELRQHDERLRRTAEVVTDDENAETSRLHTADPGGDLPPDVDPVERDNTNGEELPF